MRHPEEEIDDELIQALVLSMELSKETRADDKETHADDKEAEAKSAVIYSKSPTVRDRKEEETDDELSQAVALSLELTKEPQKAPQADEKEILVADKEPLADGKATEADSTAVNPEVEKLTEVIKSLNISYSKHKVGGNREAILQTVKKLLIQVQELLKIYYTPKIASNKFQQLLSACHGDFRHVFTLPSSKISIPTIIVNRFQRKSLQNNPGLRREIDELTTIVWTNLENNRLDLFNKSLRTAYAPGVIPHLPIDTVHQIVNKILEIIELERQHGDSEKASEDIKILHAFLAFFPDAIDILTPKLTYELLMLLTTDSDVNPFKKLLMYNSDLFSPGDISEFRGLERLSAPPVSLTKEEYVFIFTGLKKYDILPVFKKLLAPQDPPVVIDDREAHLLEHSLKPFLDFFSQLKIMADELGLSLDDFFQQLPLRLIIDEASMIVDRDKLLSKEKMVTLDIYDRNITISWPAKILSKLEMDNFENVQSEVVEFNVKHAPYDITLGYKPKFSEYFIRIPINKVAIEFLFSRLCGFYQPFLLERLEDALPKLNKSLNRMIAEYCSVNTITPKNKIFFSDNPYALYHTLDMGRFTVIEQAISFYRMVELQASLLGTNHTKYVANAAEMLVRMSVDKTKITRNLIKQNLFVIYNIVNEAITIRDIILKDVALKDSTLKFPDLAPIKSKLELLFHEYHWFDEIGTMEAGLRGEYLKQHRQQSSTKSVVQIMAQSPIALLSAPPVIATTPRNPGTDTFISMDEEEHEGLMHD